ncbi:ribosomal RNA small subunit methyltransferase G [mine drainage metagenome]|uniref:Ribosomal RNA small subunit methyltransferase G n=1 Tax=mine drainage metagenome TaxID=410659 RepID=A0A1J5RTR3_9ZZZZ
MINLALKAKLETGLAEMRLQVTVEQQEQLISYLLLITKWNKVHNLTAVRDPLEMVTLHLLDSLSVLPYVQALTAKRLLDVGAGAGLPSIPLAICMPELQVTAIDAVQKKASFMRQVKGELGLSNFHVETGRVEVLIKEPKFDVIISRAFSEMALFVKLTKHLLAEGGQWMAMKGVSPELELASLAIMEPEVDFIKTVRLKVAALQAERHLIFLRPRTSILSIS